MNETLINQAGDRLCDAADNLLSVGSSSGASIHGLGHALRRLAIALDDYRAASEQDVLTDGQIARIRGVVPWNVGN